MIREQAESLDRRRQAHIRMLQKSIERLTDRSYPEEMKTLHEAAAQLVVQIAELQDALHRVILTVEKADHTGNVIHAVTVEEALEKAKTVLANGPDLRGAASAL